MSRRIAILNPSQVSLAFMYVSLIDETQIHLEPSRDPTHSLSKFDDMWRIVKPALAVDKHDFLVE